MAARKENVKLIVAIIVVFLAIVGYRAHNDMNPPPEPTNVEVALVPSYYAATDEALASMPSEGIDSLLVKAGEIQVDKDGVPELVFNGPKAKTFPQVNLIPVIYIHGMQKNLSLAYDKIDAALLPWQKVGSLINDVAINFTQDNPDYDDIRIFCNGLRGRWRADTFVDIQVKLPTEDITPLVRNKLADLLKSIKMFIFDQAHAARKGEKPAATIERLKKEELPFMFITEQDVDLKELGKVMGAKSSSFAGIVLDLSKVKPKAAPQP